MILFLVQAHRGAAQVGALCRRLAGPASRIVLLVDRSGGFTAEEVSGLGALLDGLGGQLLHVPPITWGGPSQMWGWIDALDRAVAMRGWDWVVNLSGECLPLRAAQELDDHLADEGRRGITCRYVMYGDAGLSLDDPDSLDDLLPLQPLASPALAPFDYEQHRFAGRLDAWVENGACSGELVHDMLIRWPVRGALHCEEVGVAKQLLFRRLRPEEHERRRAFLRSTRIRGGRTWFALQRGLVDAMVSDSSRYEIARSLERFFCADELFLQTYLENRKPALPFTCHYRNLHVDQGDPLPVSDADLGRLLASDAWFVRKVDYALCPAITARFLGAALAPS